MPRKSGTFKTPDKGSILSPATVHVKEALPQVEEPPLLEKYDLSKINDPGDETAESHLSNHVDDRYTDIETSFISDIPSVNIEEDVTSAFLPITVGGDSDANLILPHETTSEKFQAISIEEGVTTNSSSTKDFVGVLPAAPIEAHDRDVDAPSSDGENIASPREGLVDSPQAFNSTLSGTENTAVRPIKVNPRAEAAFDGSQPSLIIHCEHTVEEISEKSINVAASADPSADNSTLNHSNSLEDVALVERQQIRISQTSPTKVYYQKSSVEEILIRGPAISQEIGLVAKEENLLVDSFEVGSSASSHESISTGDDTVDEPLRRTSSILAETREPSPYHGLSENESVELQRDVSTQLAQDENSVTEDGKPDTNAEDAGIKKTEIKENSETKQEQIEGPGRRTRSITRFSDDTNMLKDFVNRVQAKKAAKEIQIPVSVAAPMTSLRRSPRKALAEMDQNSPSPQRPNDLANRPGTPPGDRPLGTVDSDDPDDIVTEPTTCRRSARARFFAPATTAAGAPSLIPVRRADGEAIVPLHKSHAQELATITRANTKRNKGQSKPPKATLQTLPAEASEDAIDAPGGRGEARAVGWDETLVYYQERSDRKEGKVEKRRNVRRMRNVGATNGTPARKKLVAETDHSNGVSAARGRSKSKGKC